MIKSETNRVAKLISLTLLLLILAAGMASCGEEDAKSQQEAHPPSDRRSDGERAVEAAKRLKRASSESAVKKIEDLRFVAHVYWDTPSGPEAWRQLIHDSLLFDPVDHEVVTRELEAFRRQLPGCPQLFHAAEILTGVLSKKVEKGEAEFNELLKRSQAVWYRTADIILEAESPTISYAVWMGLARARLSDNKVRAAEQIMKQLLTEVEDLRAEERFTILMRRADLLRHELKDDSAALVLYRAASKLTPDIDLEMDEKWGAWVRQAVQELTQN